MADLLPSKYLAGFESAFELYAREGLAEATKAKATFFRVDWNDMFFMARLTNLSRYWAEDQDPPYEDSLKLPPFPGAEIEALKEKWGPSLVGFFNSEAGDFLTTAEGWASAFHGSSDIEAGNWLALMIDAVISKLEARIANEPGSIGMDVQFCGHDGQVTHDSDFHLRDVKERRESRNYAPTPEQIREFLEIFTDHVDSEWLEAAKKLGTPR